MFHKPYKYVSLIFKYFFFIFFFFNFFFLFFFFFFRLSSNTYFIDFFFSLHLLNKMSNGNEEEKEYDIIETQNSFQNVVDCQFITIMNDLIIIRNLTDIISGELTLYVLILLGTLIL